MNTRTSAALIVMSTLFLLSFSTLAQAQADLILEEISVDNNVVYTGGDPISIEAEVRNIGSAASSTYTVNYYLSTDSQITTGDTQLGSSSRPSLGPANDDNFIALVNLPLGLSAGSYFIGGIIINDDANNANNTNFEDEPISVQGPGTGGGGAGLNAGLNGNWWGGASRNGEGVQIEVSNNNTGGKVLVATMYSYNPMGEPIFLLAVGQVVNGEASVTVYIYEGPSWGAGYDPADWMETEWGTGLFTSSGCDSVSMSLTPNAAFASQGYGAISYDLIRLTNSAIPCPLP